jgi:hypothetical protein
MQTLTPANILKLRLCVARFGEMDLSAWWNTNGILGNPGRLALKRGFPSTHLFAQAQAACAVARSRCQEVFEQPDYLTLWNLPPATEASIAVLWSSWCRDADQWKPFFDKLTHFKSTDLISELLELDLITEDTANEANSLSYKGGNSIALPGTGYADEPTITLLAAAFSLNAKGSLAVPYIKRTS